MAAQPVYETGVVLQTGVFEPVFEATTTWTCNIDQYTCDRVFDMTHRKHLKNGPLSTYRAMPRKLVLDIDEVPRCNLCGGLLQLTYACVRDANKEHVVARKPLRVVFSGCGARAQSRLIVSP